MSQQWQCPTCKYTMKTYVRLSDEPTCSNEGKHSTIQMKLKERESNAGTK
jgi:hypothetical protein